MVSMHFGHQSKLPLGNYSIYTVTKMNDTMMFIVFDITFIIGIILFVILEKHESSTELSQAYNAYIQLQNTS